MPSPREQTDSHACLTSGGAASFGSGCPRSHTDRHFCGQRRVDGRAPPAVISIPCACFRTLAPRDASAGAPRGVFRPSPNAGFFCGALGRCRALAFGIGARLVQMHFAKARVVPESLPVIALGHRAGSSGSLRPCRSRGAGVPGFQLPAVSSTATARCGLARRRARSQARGREDPQADYPFRVRRRGARRGPRWFGPALLMSTGAFGASPGVPRPWAVPETRAPGSPLRASRSQGAASPTPPSAQQALCHDREFPACAPSPAGPGA